MLLTSLKENVKILFQRPILSSASSDIGLGLSLDRMRVIELNPWAPTTDAGLFAWTSAEDACVLNGERAFEFRVRERAEANMRAALMDSWRTLLEAVVAEVKRREKSAVQSANGAEP